MALAEHDADGQVLPLDQVDGGAAAAGPVVHVADGHLEVGVGARPALLRGRAEPQEGGVVDAGEGEGVRARSHGEEVALVVQSKVVSGEGLVAAVDAQDAAARQVDAANGGCDARHAGGRRLEDLWDEVAVDVVLIPT